MAEDSETRTDEDVEAHMKKLRNEEADVEAHMKKLRNEEDGDDVEAHMKKL
jgi:cell division protein FtsB